MERLGKKNYEDFDLTIFSRKTFDMFNRGQQWKDDYAMDEAGTFSKILKHAWYPFTGCCLEHAGEKQGTGPKNRTLRSAGA